MSTAVTKACGLVKVITYPATPSGFISRIEKRATEEFDNKFL